MVLLTPPTSGWAPWASGNCYSSVCKPFNFTQSLLQGLFIILLCSKLQKRGLLNSQGGYMVAFLIAKVAIKWLFGAHPDEGKIWRWLESGLFWGENGGFSRNHCGNTGHLIATKHRLLTVLRIYQQYSYRLAVRLNWKPFYSAYRNKNRRSKRNQNIPLLNIDGKPEKKTF